MNRSKELRKSNPYRVPEGYFSDLRQTLRQRVATEEAASGERGATATGWSLWEPVRSLAGLSAAFGCLVLLATAGFYWTGYRAQQRERLAMQDATTEMLSGYHLYSEDVESLDAYLAGATDEAELATEQTQFTEAVEDYLSTYGYGGETELLAVLTETGR